MIRKIEKIQAETSALGMGCWAIGGLWNIHGTPAGWGETDDNESIKAIEAAYEHGIRVFDTAANYGLGHSEKLLGKALQGNRHNCIISSKFGFKLDAEQMNVECYGSEMETSRVIEHLREDCENTLKRLNTDYLDVYFFHIWDYQKDLAMELVPELEKLVDLGKIRSYGWSTDSTELAELWIKERGFSAVQMNLNIAAPAPEMLKLCETNQVAAFNRGPLAMGFLSGKYTAESTFSKSDIRTSDWVQEAFKKPVLEKMSDLREVLTSGGRSLVQGALAWNWAVSPSTLPIPGIRTPAQAVENAKAMEMGPLSESELNQVEEIMGRR